MSSWKELELNSKDRKLYRRALGKEKTFSGLLTYENPINCQGVYLDEFEVNTDYEKLVDYEDQEVEIFGKLFTYAINGEIFEEIIPKKIRKV